MFRANLQGLNCLGSGRRLLQALAAKGRVAAFRSRLDCLRSRRRLLQESRGAAYPSAAAYTA